MKDTKVFFCGLSKKSDDILIKNIDFIINFSQESNYDINLIVVDSNSNRKIKDYLRNAANKNIKITIVDQDNLEEKISSRIQRISYCRNLCLEVIYSDIENVKIIYIPCDLDLDLFEYTNTKFLDNLIKKCEEHNKSAALFPVSYPMYYDILALRAKKWVNYNSQLINSQLKKYLKFGSFFTNYFFVFRHQWKIEKIKSKDIEIISAFGGIAIYSLGKLNKKVYYQYSDKHTEFVSEHVSFNNYFEYKNLDTSWIVNAPMEHIHFHKLTFYKKIVYLFKTIKYDIYN